MKHAFTKRVASWFYCKHCGLVLLKNAATQAAVAKGCPDAE